MQKIVVIPILALIVLAVIVCLIIVNPFSEPVCSSIENSITQATEAETFQVRGSIEAEFQTEDLGELRQIQASLSFDEKIDKTDPANPKAYIDLDLSLGAEGLAIRLKADVRSFGQDLYFRITSLPSASFLEGFDLTGIKNQWYRFNSRDLLGAGLQEQPEALDQAKAQALLDDLKNLIKDKDIFEIKKDLGDQELNGKKTKHYLVELKKNSVKELLPQVLELVVDYLPEQDRAEYKNNLEQFKAQLDQSFDDGWQSLSPIELDFWIEKDSCNVSRIKFEKTFENNSQVKFDLEFLSFNQAFQIEQPTNAKPLEEILSSLFLGPELLIEE